MDRLFQFLQMEPLIKHWAFATLDMLIIELFPELNQYLSQQQHT
jgi:hypothetical protein